MTDTLFKQLCDSKTLFNAWKIIKKKGSSGGIDGVSIGEFEENLSANLQHLQEELVNGKWNPFPYLRISIPKKNYERRKLGMLCIKDKIVQQAIKILVEPRFERLFLACSYGYRPQKGHTKAIRCASYCMQDKRNTLILKLDIHSYFDCIDHKILFQRLQAVVSDLEILRLIELCTKMGVVGKDMKWEEISQGVAQGAVLSPLLSNFYLHAFDQFMTSKTKYYVRYADDFIVCCQNQEEADHLLKGITEFLNERLKLSLNEPIVRSIDEGVEFLGILISRKGLSLTDEKKETLHQNINLLNWSEKGFGTEGLLKLNAIKRYYAPLLADSYLQDFDTQLLSRLRNIIFQDWKKIPNKQLLKESLCKIDFYADATILNKSQHINELVQHYLNIKSSVMVRKNQEANKTLIQARKREYRKRENESTELVVSSPGSFIGIKKGVLVLKIYGKQEKIPSVSNLKHITIMSSGVSISSSIVEYCVKNSIPIDYFSYTGHHTAVLISNSLMQDSLWRMQALMAEDKKAVLASRIIYGKLKNQLNLIKYFHKYHKKTSDDLCKVYDEVYPKLIELLDKLIHYVPTADYKTEIMGWEAACANLYWSYLRELVKDDHVGFESRERHGATDLMNCMLNYGYAILYSRVWKSILYRQLNPFDSVLHVPNAGKPTFVFDVVELFRAQCVDRVVVSLIQKGENLKIEKGLLSNDTRRLLISNILERLNRYEIYREKEVRLCDIINLQTKNIADYISKDIKFKPYIAKW